MIWVVVYALTGEIHSITSFLEGGQAIRAGLVGRVEFSVSGKKNAGSKLVHVPVFLWS